MPAQSVGPAPQPSARALVGGIIDDVHDLAEQKVDLARREIELDIERRARAGAVVAAGAMIVLAGLVLLGLAAAHLLHSAAPDRLSLWASHALVGLVVAGAGVVPALIGRSMLSPDPNPTPRP